MEELSTATIPADLVTAGGSFGVCEEGQVRLRGGFESSNGLVEYCHHRTWGTVCREGWDNNDARVVCAQLGYNPDGMFHLVDQ